MASKVSGIIEQIQPGGSNGTKYAIASTAYGYCTTSANEPAKTVDMTDFKLIEGVTIHVKFKEKNSASSPTLNVNGTGAKNIVQYGTTAASTADETSGWYAGAVVSFTYDGASWVRDQGFNTNVDTKVTQTISSTENADYRILLSGTADDTTRAEGARKDTDFKYNPSTNTITIGTGTLSATAYSGTAANVTGTVAVAHGGTGVTTVDDIFATYGVEYIVGTQTGTKATNWTGQTKSTELYVGKTIAYQLPIAGDGSATLELTFPDGTTTGQKAVYAGNTRLTTHYPANSIMIMVWNGTNWRTNPYYNTNTNTLMRTYALSPDVEFPILAGSQTTAGAWTTDYTSSYKDLYGIITSTTANRATINPSTGHITAPAGITANITGNISGTASNVTGTVAIEHGGTGKTTAAEAWTALGGGASGTHADSYFVKAITSTDNAIVRFDGTSGQIQNSGVIIDDNNNLTVGSNKILNNTGAPGQGEMLLTVLGFKTGYPVYTDPTFLSGTNSVSVYNNSGGGTVVHTRGTYSSFNISSPGTDSNYVIKIETNGTASPGCGGFFQTITARANAVFVQIFRALVPINRSLNTASNNMGNSYKDEWLTSTAGTGKWEWYARRVICGQEGTMSSGGHIYINGASPVTWYLASCNVYDVTKTEYDGLKTRYADQANAANITSTTNAITYYTNTTGTFGSKASANGALYATTTNGALQWGTLPIAQGGTGKTSAAEAWTALGGGASGKHADSYFALASHNHAAGDINSGTFDLARIPTITNAKLTNSSLTVGNKSISLGSSGTVHDILKTSTNIGTDTSWDQYDPGIYYVASSAAFTGTNSPENANTNNGISPYRYGQLIVSRAGTGGVAQFYISHNDSNSASYGIHYRTGWNSTYVDKWSVLLDSHNYTNYTVKKDGTGASGTWGISINGTAAKAIADADNNTISSTYLKRSGGEMTGPLTWKDSTALPEASSLSYVLGIDAFASGGTTKWTSIANLRSSLGLLNNTGSESSPIYINANGVLTECTWNLLRRKKIGTESDHQRSVIALCKLSANNTGINSH